MPRAYQERGPMKIKNEVLQKLKMKLKGAYKTWIEGKKAFNIKVPCIQLVSDFLAKQSDNKGQANNKAFNFTFFYSAFSHEE